jgi:hypothetical protein
MAVEALSAFPASVVAGDTLRLDLSDGDYPSGTWSLSVVLRGADVIKTFGADSVSGNAYELVIAASDMAKLPPGPYSVTYVYTDGDERASVPMGTTQVTVDPTQAAPKSIARRTLVAMEKALEELAGGSNASVSFNGQSFSKKNLKELQDAIDRQRLIVAREDNAADLAAGRGRSRNIYTRFGPFGSCGEYCSYVGLDPVRHQRRRRFAGELAALVQKSRDLFKLNPYMRKFRTDLIANVFGSEGITLQMKIKEEADRVVYADDGREQHPWSSRRESMAGSETAQPMMTCVERAKKHGIKLRSPGVRFSHHDGHNGSTRAKAVVKAGQPDVYANNLIERAWKRWQKRENCTVSKRHTYAQTREQRLTMCARDGDVFIRHVRGFRGPERLQLRHSTHRQRNGWITRSIGSCPTAITSRWASNTTNGARSRRTTSSSASPATGNTALTASHGRRFLQRAATTSGWMRAT